MRFGTVALDLAQNGDWVQRRPRDADNISMEALLLISAGIITALVVWIGRKRLRVALPCAFAFLLYASILIPNLLPPRSVYAQTACVANLRLIQNAKVEWAKNNPLTTDSPPRMEQLFPSHTRDCPNGGQYTIGGINQSPTCSLATNGHVLQ